MIQSSENRKQSKLIGEQDVSLYSSDFGLPQEQSFPMPDAAHVRTAEAFFNFANEDQKPLLAYRILIKAREFRVIIKNPAIIAWAKKYIDER